MSDYNIPEEILIEILLKVPAKSLIRFTSVCKEWKSVIISPSFISLHLANAENQLLLWDYNIRKQYAVVPKREPLSMKVIHIPFECPIEYYRIIGSCNGLLCLSNSNSDELCVNPLANVIVWNPCIRKHVVLPQSFINRKRALLGFGVATNVYKVVRLVYHRKSAPPRAEIFTLGTGTWRKLSDGIGAYISRPYRGHSLFFKGFLHWIVCESTGTNGVYRDLILTFDVGDEVFGEIVLPEELERESVANLSIIGESFGAINYLGNNSCDVWIMKDYGVTESWTKLYRIGCDGFQRVIGFLENSELLLDVNNCLVIYNAKTKEIKYARVLRNRHSWYVGDFKESLIWLGGYTGESNLGATSTIQS